MPAPSDPLSAVVTTELRVRYAETDQMGVVYHARYLDWCDVARTEYLRCHGASYRELEAGGLLLAVVDATLRYRAPARFDDRVRIHCWVRDVATRKVVFGYLIECADDGRRLATAQTGLIALDSTYALSAIPAAVRAALVPIPDPVRL
jgi:acyl-CoA thioester hydrolase